MKPESQTSRNNSLSMVACTRIQVLGFLSSPPLQEDLQAYKRPQCVVCGFRNISETDIGTLQQGQQMLQGGSWRWLGEDICWSHQCVGLEPSGWWYPWASGFHHSFEPSSVCVFVGKFVFLEQIEYTNQSLWKNLPWPWQKQQMASPATIFDPMIIFVQKQWNTVMEKEPIS